MVKLKVVGTTVALSASLLLAGCGGGDETQTKSDSSISEELEYTITGIEPGAGLTGLTHDALEDYDNLEGWELHESSTAGMVTELRQAIDNEEPIVVSGWSPHWKFAEFDIKFLEDPEGSFGGEEGIHTIARLGLEEDMPGAYQILDAFAWEVEDMESVMHEAQDISFEEAAQNWIEENQDTVDQWTEGAEQGGGTSIALVSTPWDSERASSNVIKIVLESQGYSVTVTDVDPAVMFEALVNDGADASIAPWLPIAHGALYENHKDNLDDLGSNLQGAKNGLAVPSYMEIDSIEDLEPKE